MVVVLAFDLATGRIIKKYRTAEPKWVVRYFRNGSYEELDINVDRVKEIRSDKEDVVAFIKELVKVFRNCASNPHDWYTTLACLNTLSSHLLGRGDVGHTHRFEFTFKADSRGKYVVAYDGTKIEDDIYLRVEFKAYK